MDFILLTPRHRSLRTADIYNLQMGFIAPAAYARVS